MNKSISKTILDETLFSGTTGRMYSTRIPLPEFARAFQQFLRSFKQCSSLQSLSIHCKFQVLIYWRKIFFFFFFLRAWLHWCQNYCIYNCIFSQNTTPKWWEWEREPSMGKCLYLMLKQGKLPTIKAMVNAWYGVERFQTIVSLLLHSLFMTPHANLLC